MLIPREIFAIAEVADDENHGRYIVDAVQFSRDENGAPLAVATDGRKLIVVTWKERPPGDCQGLYPEHPTEHNPSLRALVPREACKRAVGSMPERYRGPLDNLDDIVLLDESGTETFSLVTTDTATQVAVTAKPPEGEYINWRETFKQTEAPGTTIRLGVKHLAMLAAAMRDVLPGGGEKGATIQLTIPEGNAGAVLFTGSGQDGRVVAALLATVSGDTPPAPGRIPGITKTEEGD